VTSIERIAREEGKMAGKPEGMAAAKVDALLRIRTKRFQPALPADMVMRIRATDDLPKLDSWIDIGLEASDLDQFRRTCRI
jgi:hypothetical protein